METVLIVCGENYTPYEGMAHGAIVRLWLAADTNDMSAYLIAVHGDKVRCRQITETQAERLATLLRQRA